MGVDRTALVVGGSSGIGLATARHLLDVGVRVMITGRDEAALERAGATLGGRATTVRSDVGSATDRADLAGRVEQDLGALDLLFVSAGVNLFTPLAQMTEQAFDTVFDVNVKGPYFVVQALAPLIRAGGSVVLTTSVLDVKGQDAVSAYAASKAAVRSMTRSFARELQPQGIRVNAVSPGPVDTGILERSLPAPAAAAARDRMTGNNPMGRFGDPAEIARAVAFLAFEATFTTGSELAVDGGTSQL